MSAVGTPARVLQTVPDNLGIDNMGILSSEAEVGTSLAVDPIAGSYEALLAAVGANPGVYKTTDKDGNALWLVTVRPS